MKLKNKKTGEIVEVESFYLTQTQELCLNYINEENKQKVYMTDKIASFNLDWEDYEEPKVFYIVEQRGIVGSRFRTGIEYEKEFKQIGNYFESKEEAEQAVKKLKAWKRVKRDLVSLHWQRERDGNFSVWGEFKTGNTLRADVFLDNHSEDLDLLFGGEE